MRIVVPQQFRHAGELLPRHASRDPRRDVPEDGQLDIDMRRCEFVRPPAVHWSAVYLALAASKGAACRLLMPENMGVCVYLKSVGLFSFLQGIGVEVDDRGVSDRLDRKVVLPVTGFRTESEVETLANQVLDSLAREGLGAANLRPVVTEIFSELAMNAVQHSESAVGAFGLIQFYGVARNQRFVCVVADGGIGIRESLQRNPALRDEVPYDWLAIERATQERVTGSGDATRGIGLYGVSEDMRKPSRQLIIHSGIGMLVIGRILGGDDRDDAESSARRSTLFPGTLAYAAIPT